MIKGRNLLIALATAIFLSACGGGGDDSISVPPVTDDLPGGIWRGTSSDGAELLGLVTESGQFHFVSLEDGIQYFGDIDTAEHDVSGDFTGVAPFDTGFEDGSTSGTGTITGTLNERSTFNGTTDFTTSEGTNIMQDFTLDYDDLYDRDSSLDTVEGNFSQVGTDDVLNVNSDGEVFLQDDASGCVVNGNVEVIDSKFNAYKVEFTYGSCTGDFEDLNDKTFSGLATLDNSETPERLIVGATSSVGAQGVSVIWVFERT